jgi:hypothetical protein
LADIVAIVDTFKVNLAHSLVGAGQGIFERGCCGSGREDAASMGEQLVPHLGGAGVENFDSRDLGGGAETGNGES